VDGGQGALENCPLDPENQLGILPEKNAEEPQYAFLPDKRTGLWKIEFSTIGQKPPEAFQITGIDEFEEIKHCALARHGSISPFPALVPQTQSGHRTGILPPKEGKVKRQGFLTRFFAMANDGKQPWRKVE